MPAQSCLYGLVHNKKKMNDIKLCSNLIEDNLQTGIMKNQ